MNFQPRRRRLVKSRLQVRVSLSFATLTVLGLVLQAFLLHRASSAWAGKASSVDELMRELPTQIVVSVVLASAVLIPVILLAGILLTQRIAGAAHRMETHLRDWIAGRDQGPCQLRRSDDLQELCALLNEALALADEEAGEEFEEGVEELDAA